VKSSDGLDIAGRAHLRALGVDNLVTGEESEDVVVSGEDLNNLKDVLEVHGSVGGPWLHIVQVLVLKGRVDIEHEVDAGSGKHGHALVVVNMGVDGVDTDGVDAELLEQEDVTSANLGVGERVGAALVGSTSTGLVINTLHEERFAGLAVDKVAVLDLNDVDGRGHGGGQSGQSD